MHVVTSGASTYFLLKIFEHFSLTFFDNWVYKRSGLTASTTTTLQRETSGQTNYLISLATEPRQYKGFHKQNQRVGVFVGNTGQDWICTLLYWNKLYHLGM